MLLALSLIIFILEAQLPPLAPIPGIKMGLSNVITLVTLVWYGRRDAFLQLMLRITLGSIFAGQAVSFLYSMSGGLLCFFVMALLLKPIGNDKLWVISVFGAIAHNAGQIIAAVIILSSWAAAAYFPILVVSAVITGAFTGLLATCVMKNKYLEYLVKNK